MPRVTAHMSMRGVDLKEMMAQAKEKMAEVAPGAKFRITEMEMHDLGEDMATKQGMARMFNCTMTMEANVEE